MGKTTLATQSRLIGFTKEPLYISKFSNCLKKFPFKSITGLKSPFYSTSSPGRFSLALGAKAREKRPGDEVAFYSIQAILALKCIREKFKDS